MAVRKRLDVLLVEKTFLRRDHGLVMLSYAKPSRLMARSFLKLGKLFLLTQKLLFVIQHAIMFHVQH